MIHKLGVSTTFLGMNFQHHSTLTYKVNISNCRRPPSPLFPPPSSLSPHVSTPTGKGQEAPQGREVSKRETDTHVRMNLIEIAFISLSFTFFNQLGYL